MTARNTLAALCVGVLTWGVVLLVLAARGSITWN